ncbi:hypothetical protein R1flu_020777 [Riccia fluitans]|uniref:SAM-dependent MTase DRM-type domain-containing protein n=1 Tax=Riccia fluitans TaxID=41844 RepID=A0ABD1ZMH3_9MARC
MGDIGAISDLVTGMCNSVVVQPHPTSPPNPPGASSSIRAAIDSAAAEAASIALAKLIWVGYSHEQASEAIRLCGSVDPDEIAEFIVKQTESEAKAVKNRLRNDTSFRPQTAVLRICEPGNGNSSLEAIPPTSEVVIGKGKAPMYQENDKDPEPDDVRPGLSSAETATGILVQMGFKTEDIANAIKVHGSGDVDILANYIVSASSDLHLDQDHREVINGESSNPSDLDLEEKDDLPYQDLEVFKQVTAMEFDAVKVSRAIGICGVTASVDQVLDLLTGDGASEKVETPMNEDADEDNTSSSKLDQLLEMGYRYVQCRRAVDTYGEDSIFELCDYLDALREEDNAEEGLDLELSSRNGRSSSDSDDEYDEEVKDVYQQKKRRKGRGKTAQIARNKKLCSPGKEDMIHRNRTGFGLPGGTVIARTLPVDVARPPYFFFENVENMPQGEWSNIRRHLFNIEPEIMDALNFSVCRRPRGYIHNLPLEGREVILAKPPMTIQELMGNAAKYWPSWDKRVKLNTICTRSATDFVWRQIKDHLEACEKRGYPSEEEVKNIMYWARKWNLVWVQPNKLAPLSPEEVEISLGFDKHHTRILYSPVDRIKVLGNSFQGFHGEDGRILCYTFHIRFRKGVHMERMIIGFQQLVQLIQHDRKGLESGVRNCAHIVSCLVEKCIRVEGILYRSSCPGFCTFSLSVTVFSPGSRGSAHFVCKFLIFLECGNFPGKEGMVARHLG